jgi:hypothetical protein
MNTETGVGEIQVAQHLPSMCKSLKFSLQYCQQKRVIKIFSIYDGHPLSNMLGNRSVLDSRYFSDFGIFTNT